MAVSVLMGMCLVGCGPSLDRLAKAESARDELAQMRTDVDETYLDITDSSKGNTLSEMSKQVTEIQETDLKKLSNEEIDELLLSMDALTKQYQQLDEELTAIKTEETQTKEEREKHSYLDVYILNKTGMNLSKIVLHDLTTDTVSTSYLKDGAILQAGYTLMGVSLDLYKDSKEWEFIVTEENGTDHILTAEGLDQQKTKSAALILSYDEKTGTGSAGFGTDE